MFHDLKDNIFKKNLEKSSLEVDFPISGYLIILFFALFVLFAFALETSRQSCVIMNYYSHPFTIYPSTTLVS